MLFVILITFTKFINALDDTESSVPVSVPIDAMKTNLDKNQNCNIEIECAGDDLYNPKCGKKCWSTGSAEDYLEYTFKGVKFEIYGIVSQNDCNFEVFRGEDSLGVPDLASLPKNEITKLYTSDEFDYDSYKVKIKGIENNRFEIHKITFYPSMKAVRINVTELYTSKSWADVSDKIGGLYSYSNAIGAFKRAVVECSRVWVYGSKDSTLGKLQISFGGDTTEVNELSGEVEELSLIYESTKKEFGKYELSINRIKNRVLVYYIYYLSDGPEKTPEPSIEYTPDSADSYVDKNLGDLPNNGIIIQTNSAVNQISGSTFTDINSEVDYLIRIDKQIDFFGNTIKYTDTSKTYPSFIHANYKGTLTIQNCNFINARCSKEIGIKGNIFFSDQQISVIFDTCEFIDCGNENKEQLILQNDPLSSIQLINCKFQFHDILQSCKVFYSTSSNVDIDGCAFDKCGVESICMPCRSKIGDFSFTNNNIQNVIEQFILVNNLKAGLTFSGNVFHDINIEGGYFITINHNQEEVGIINNTFNKISSGNGEVYGGGLSLWFARDERRRYELQFIDCKFYDIKNNNYGKPYNQGGAIQYGYSSSISNVAMLFHNCEFIGNKCTNKSSSGGAIGLNVNHDIVISHCRFEQNSAKVSGGCIYISGEIVDSITGDKKESEIEKIVITNCQFISNVAVAGTALYTYYYGVVNAKIFIESCTFTDNGERLNSFPVSCESSNVNFFNNTFKYTDTSIKRGFISLNQIVNANLTNCTFINGYATDGSIKFNNQYSSAFTTINKCDFINCVYPGNCFINVLGTSEITSVNFIYDNIDESSGAINFGDRTFVLRDSYFSKTNSNGAIVFNQAYYYNEPAVITGCTFDGCAGTNSICFNIVINLFVFTFNNNTIKNTDRAGSSTYIGSIQCIREGGSILFDNINFINNKCDALYGGGTGLWIEKYKEIKFINCKFINNEAYKSNAQRQDPISDKEYFSGDGGAIQFGYSELIYKSNIIFTDCAFTGNKAVRHGGAIALQNVGSVEITHCIFENNVGNYKPSSSKLLDFNNYYSYKKEGRGGAIYLNPAFQHNQSDPNLFMSRVDITQCTFTENFAFDGHGIYIEGDDPGTVFSINSNEFIDNYDKSSPSNEKSIILTEIYRIYDSNINTTNTFTNENPSIKIESVLYLENHGYIPSPSITEDPIIDELEIINITSIGRQEFINDDLSRILIIVMVSKFNNIVSRKDGGAIHIKNAGIICNETLFENCSSLEGGGGALYLINKLNNANVVTLIQDQVHLCEAQYGGGFYIYSNNWNNRVIIKQCKFTENKVYAKETEGKKYGGSGVYVTSRKGTIKQNTFIDNMGPGSTLMKNNNFDEENSVKILDEEPFVISNCHFKIFDNSNSAVFYVKGKNGNLVKLFDCTFEGNLAKGGHFIDGVSISNDSPKMVIKNCKFLGDEKDSFLSLSDALTTNKNDAFISSINREKRTDSRKAAFIIVPVSAAITFTIISIIIVFAVKKKNSNLLTDDEMPSEENGI